MIDLLINRYPEIEYLKDNIFSLVDSLVSCYNRGGKVLICGNGGSCADADHIAGELLKGFLLKRPVSAEDRAKLLNCNYDNSDILADSLQQGIAAVSLCSHSSLLTAVINDIGASMMYAQQVYAMGNPNDILIGISTSGNAQNVVNALKVAKAFGLITIGMTGNRGGQMNNYSDILIDVPAGETYLIQEYHIAIYHAFCAAVEARLFKS